MSNKKAKEKSKARKIYDIVSTIIIALVFIFLVAVVGLLLWQRKAGTDSNIFGYYLYNVLTDSMEPTINTGDIIICKKVDDKNSLQVGDIITFTAPSGRLKGYNETHRIYSIERNADGTIKYIKTAGDNMYGGDEVKVDEWQLNASDVKAVYKKTTKLISGLRSFLTKWYGYVILIVIPLLIVFGLFIAGMVQDKLNSEKEKLNKEKKENILSDADKERIAKEYLNNKENNEEDKD